jgi:hypothetical protein
MKGDGAWAQLIRQRVEKGAVRAGLVREVPALDFSGFVRPTPLAGGRDDGQGELF